MNEPINNEQAWAAWDAQIEADLKAGKLDALIEAARDEFNLHIFESNS